MVVTLFIASGCSPISNRFISRTLEHLTDPIEPVTHRVTNPILPDVGVAVLWSGHATVLIQIHDKIFITDPVFTKTVGMVARRAIEPGLDPSSLSKVDYTLISHIHFDHFSYGSLDMLPKNGTLLIPWGGAPYTPEMGFTQTREMKPWEVLEEDGVRITAVPAQHFSGRYGLDISWMRDRGYTGYVIQYKGKTVFVAGDTGYNSDLFKDIGKNFNIDVAILPIAPVEPREFMQRNHVDPKEAVQIFEDVKAKIMIPMHHRTFIQGFEPTIFYAQELLEKIIKERGLEDKIKILNIGEQRVLMKE
ncbi:MAG: MBL fold metallo-hydrolase [Ignavibacteriales bacterium]|nr:MBL fold metallo-hydrolase [Ignavibacteriales bacterium]